MSNRQLSGVCFTERFDQIAARFPELTAVECGPVRLSYRQLHERAIRLGSLLRSLGAGPEVVVGLGLEKGPDYLVALLGVWYAGAAFVPLAPSLPEERLRFMAHDSGARLVLVGEQAGALGELGVPAVPVGAATDDGMPPYECSPEDLAYVIYTSGSTGAPKGVLVPHRGLVNVLEEQIRAFRLGPGSRSLFYLSPSFDASISDIGTALLSGATLVIEPAGALRTAAQILEVLERRQITYVDLPPALLRLLDPANAPDCLETIVIGGEPCPVEVVRRWAARCRVINVYGPTEATICTSMIKCDREHWQRPLIGDPIAGITYHFLDAERRPVPPGTEAELWIGGIGLARGYRNRAELEAERFVMVGEERLYRTGDRVLRHPDGGVEFLGRVDRQVKLRGALVAPEEIEAQLLRHPEIAQATVVKVGVGERELLVAYVVLKGGRCVPAQELRQSLARVLPGWMLPQRYEFLDALPVTPNGKVDLAALSARSPGSKPEAEPTAVQQQAVPPGPERLLVEIWERQLGVRPVGIHDDFYALGGDSLALLQVIAAAGARGLALSPELLQAHPTIAGLLEALQASGEHASPAAACRWLREDVTFDGEWRERLREARCRPGFPPPAAAPERILLTGATGFLGLQLLRELLTRTRAVIVCLVRAAGSAEGERRLTELLQRSGGPLSAAEARRVMVLPGDLAAPRFGLGETEWTRVADGIDTVYHCAAQVNMLLPYAALRPANVEGTREILRLLCEGRRKRLNYASTLSVLVSTDQNQGCLSESDDLQRTEWVYGGYAQTKWAAEHLLRQAGESAGPVGCYRLGLLTSDSRTGRTAPSDFLSMFFRGVSALGCVPDGIEELRVDITPIDYAAAAMAHLSLGASEGGFTTFHVANPHSASAADLVQALARAGLHLSRVGQEAWSERVRLLLAQPGQGAREEDLAAAYLALCRCLPDEASFPRWRAMDLFQATGARFDLTATEAGLRGSAIACPPASPELLESYARMALGQPPRSNTPARKGFE